MKKLLSYLLVALSTITITAIVFFNCNDFSIGPHINFQTKNGEFRFTAIPSKGRDHKMLERRFDSFKQKNPELGNIVLYRTTGKLYLNVCMWVEYKIRPEWQYPYLYFWER